MAEDLEYLQYIFTEGLYVVGDAPPQAKEAPPIKYLGANEKGAVFIVSDPTHDFLNTKEHGFLMKIIESGLRMSKFDIAIVNAANQPFDRIMDEVPGKYYIGFNIAELESLTSGLKYIVQEIHGKNMLSADTLSDIEADVEKKRVLWNALQVMFDIQKSKS
ncbi:MAG: hypothetical protein U5K79_18015 [Cyclobacteriaceae bacterium]|nr:hypothetical protein [Cyclobacteriaceae bacterium]